jgi:hypothetical protein
MIKMDLLVGLRTFAQQRENFDKKDESNKKDNSITVGSIISAIISVAIGCYAVYLSWTCNTAAGVSTGMKVFFAFFAFIFGLIYLLFYLIVNYGKCGGVKQ